MKNSLRTKLIASLSVASMALSIAFSAVVPAYADTTTDMIQNAVSDEVFEEEEEYSEGGLFQSYRTTKTEKTSVQIDFEIQMPEHFAYDVYADLMNTQNGDVYKFSITSANGYTDRAWVEPGTYKLMQVYVHGDNVGAYPFVWDANVMTFAENETYKFAPVFQKYDEVSEEIAEAYVQRENDFGIDFAGNLIGGAEDGEDNTEGLNGVYDFDMTTTPYMTPSRSDSGRIWVIGKTDYTYNLKVEITTVDERVLPTTTDANGNVVPEMPEFNKVYFKLCVNDTYETYSVYVGGEAVSSEVFTVPLSGFYEFGDITLYFDTTYGEFEVGDTYDAYILSYENVVVQKYEGEGNTLWELTPKNGKTLFDALKDSDINLAIRIEKSGDAGTAVWSISEDGGETYGEQEYAKDVLEFEDFTITFLKSDVDPTLFTKGGIFSFTYSMPEVSTPFSMATVVALIFLVTVIVVFFFVVNKKMKDKMPKDNQYTIQR